MVDHLEVGLHGRLVDPASLLGVPEADRSSSRLLANPTVISYVTTLRWDLTGKVARLQQTGAAG